MSYVVKAPRMNELSAWLKCNDVSPSDVPYPSVVLVETADGEAWFIQYEAYVRNASGHITYDAVTETFEYEVRTIPMVSDPPMWWLTEAPPLATGMADGDAPAADAVAEGPAPAAAP